MVAFHLGVLALRTRQVEVMRCRPVHHAKTSYPNEGFIALLAECTCGVRLAGKFSTSMHVFASLAEPLSVSQVRPTCEAGQVLRFNIR
jgi:hypothetical protein